jgi:hypothetical protein
MNEVKYRIHCDIALPIRMEGELGYQEAFEMVCDWNDTNAVEHMCWLERCDDGCR